MPDTTYNPGALVDRANILASDMPGTVVRKLDDAWQNSEAPAAHALAAHAIAELRRLGYTVSGNLLFPPDSLHADAKLQEAYAVLREHAEGRRTHVQYGLCPDILTGYDSRDTDCPVCQALIATAAHSLEQA